jgi:hypothetical protein
MPKSVSITVTVTLSAEVPKSWKDDDLQDKVGEAVTADVVSGNKKIVLGDIDEVTVEVEEDE